MRICLITREYPPLTRYSGGIGRSFAVFAPELARQGNETHVITFTPGSSTRLKRDGVHIHLLRLPERRRLWFLDNLRWGFSVDRALRRLGPFDVVLAAEWGGDAWRYSRHQRSGPLVTFLCTSLDQILEIEHESRSPLDIKLLHAIQRRLERRQAQRSSALIARSQAILSWARKLWDIEHVPSSVVPNMIDVGRVRRLASGELPPGFPDKGPTIVFFGRLEVRKGVIELVQAMQDVWKDWPDAELVMIGRDGPWDGRPLSTHLRELAGPNADRLHVLGAQSPETLFPAVGAADVVALPSRWEAFGLVALESMALGRPTILTSGSGFEDFFRPDRDGLMVPPDDPPALANALLRLLGDSALRRRFGDSSSARAEHYDAPVVTRDYAENLRRVADDQS